MRKSFIVLGLLLAAGYLFAVTNSFAGAMDAEAKIYKKHCKKCHALDGSGKKKSGDWLPIHKSLKLEKPELLSIISEEAKKSPDDAIRKSMVEGKGKMKAYKDKLSADEIEMMVKYTRHLQAEAK